MVSHSPQIGFGKNGSSVDCGRCNVTFNPKDLYKFRTPSLINVSSTAPYGHSGSLPTLRDAVVSQHDPFRNLKPDTMTLLARYEHFKRMATSAPKINLIGILTRKEVGLVVEF